MDSFASKYWRPTEDSSLKGTAFHLASKSENGTQPELQNSTYFYSGDINKYNKTMDPLITGYSFIVWTRLPNWFFKATNETFGNFAKLTQTNFRAYSGVNDMELQTEDYALGFAGNNHSVAKSMQKWNEFSVTHREFSGSPIMNCYKMWISGIRDPRTGLATYPNFAEGDEREYNHYNHSGELMYMVTRPDAMNPDINPVEFAIYWTEVIPTKIPLAHFNYTQGDNAIHELEIPFKGHPNLGPSVYDAAWKLLKSDSARGYMFRSEWEMGDPLAANMKPDMAEAGL